MNASVDWGDGMAACCTTGLVVRIAWALGSGWPHNDTCMTCTKHHAASSGTLLHGALCAKSMSSHSRTFT